MTVLDTVVNYLAALGKGDVPAAFALFADDVKWHQPGNNKFSGIKSGSANIGEMIGAMMADTQGSFALAPNGNIMVNGSLVACPVRFSGKKADGSTIDMTGIDLFEVVNGKIQNVWLFSDDQAVEDQFWGK